MICRMDGAGPFGNKTQKIQPRLPLMVGSTPSEKPWNQSKSMEMLSESSTLVAMVTHLLSCGIQKKLWMTSTRHLKSDDFSPTWTRPPHSSKLNRYSCGGSKRNS